MVILTRKTFEEPDTLFIGLDESNNGRFPEIHVAAFSLFPRDVVLTNYDAKIRDDHRRVINLLNCQRRDYTFILLNEIDKARLPRKKFRGIVMSTLCKDAPLLNHQEFFQFYFDGPLMPSHAEYARDHLAEILDVQKKRVHIESGKDFDLKYPIVHYADAMAHYLFRKKTIEEIAESSQRRILLK